MTIEIHGNEVNSIIKELQMALAQCNRQLAYWNRFDSEYANQRKESLMQRITRIENHITTLERGKKK